MAGQSLRRMNSAQRRAALVARYPDTAALMDQARESATLEDLSELMVECPIGFFGLPLGVASGFMINGEGVDIPMATEEPSVVAAASFAAGLVAHAGGFSCTQTGDIVTAQIWLEGVPPNGEAQVCGQALDRPLGLLPETEVSKNSAREQGALPCALLPEVDTRLSEILAKALPSLVRRGGGYAGADLLRFAQPEGLVRVHIRLHVLDAMGANLANTAAEAAAPFFENLIGGRALARILTNESAERLASASFALPLRYLRRAGIPGQELARRMMLFSRVAMLDRARAITHNKGIMNGVTALVLATGNDTRAVEAAAHAYASRSGAYLPLTEYCIEGEMLKGRISLPVPLGTVSSTAALHPGARLSLALLGNPSAARLGCILAALGLAQNLAAMAALVGEGIQSGHMRLHARRTAYLAGARGDEIYQIADQLSLSGSISLDSARQLFDQLRSQDS